jgi:hypothetical protein
MVMWRVWLEMESSEDNSEWQCCGGLAYVKQVNLFKTETNELKKALFGQGFW